MAQQKEKMLKEEFIERMKKIQKEKVVKIGTLKNFKKHYGLE